MMSAFTMSLNSPVWASKPQGKINMASVQQVDEFLEASVGMAHGEEWSLHTASLLRRVFKGAALMSRDMIGLVAFDFILGIVFRGVTYMPLVVEVLGVDSNDCPRHPTRFGIPTYMIVDLEPLSHLVDSSLTNTLIRRPDTWLSLPAQRAHTPRLAPHCQLHRCRSLP
jgi:hypothetical protein